MSKEKPEYNCTVCKYSCQRLFLWKQHLQTKKHLKNTGKSTKTPKIHKSKEKDAKFKCNYCDKTYKQRSGLWKHYESHHDMENQLEIENNELEKQNTDLKLLMKEMITGLNQQSQFKDEMMVQIKKQNEIIHDMLPRMGNNNNNKFNINLFLNDKCRNAINMSEFIESLQIQLEDLNYTKNNGLIEGVSFVLINGLKQLDTFKRPIHCTDIKRETLYIKENNEWERENTGKDKLRQVINEVASKHRDAVIDSEITKPKIIETDNDKDEYIKMVKNVMTDLSESSSENKIIKNIIKETIIDK